MSKNTERRLANELGFRRAGIGKQYSYQDLKRFIDEAEQKITPQVDTQNENRLNEYISHKRAETLLRDQINPLEISDLWSVAVNNKRITNLERIFYLGVDIARIRNNNRPVESMQYPIASLSSQFVKNESLFISFFYPALVTPSHFLSISRASGESCEEDFIIIRSVLNNKWPPDQEYGFFLTKLKNSPPESRFFDGSAKFLGRNSNNNQDFYALTDEQTNTFGQRLWRAHLNTPLTV